MDKKSIKPKKSLGQNFLKARHVVNKIIQTAELEKQDTVLEIGPGLGALTKEIAPLVKKLIAVEKDWELVKILREEMPKNVEIVNDDILKYKLQATSYKLLANLPYSIVAPVLRKFLEAEHKPKLMVLMVQKEVAQRICAKPPKMSLLAVSVQFYATPKIVSYVSKRAFWPQPKVDSAIIKITPCLTPGVKHSDRFFKIVKAGFSHPRKQLVNNLGKELGIERAKIISWLSKAHIHPTQRAQTLTIQDWENLTIITPPYLPPLET
ncbi:ribosomal RNA small subunit methyltransferase A [Patescibacteria group bacterium]|nr:ribosomal RNA small subunit methyltransferase A [Patescibacteria group bacterium]